MKTAKPLDSRQQDLIEILRIAHRTLAVARKTRNSELERRIQQEKNRLDGELFKARARLKMEIDAEIAFHEISLDEALIAAYDADIAVRTISVQGFGNRYDGGVQQLLVKLRADNRVGSRRGWQSDDGTIDNTARFPSPVDVVNLLNESEVIHEPVFIAAEEALVLVQASSPGAGDEVTTTAVVLQLDARDPWFESIAKKGRVDSPYLKATSCILYIHPATNKLAAYESKETGEETHDHPVARWAKVHPDEALAGFDAAIAEASE